MQTVTVTTYTTESTQDKDGKQIVQEVSDSEKANLQKDENGKVRISDNGIFNDEKAAIKYASQHA